MVDQNGVMDSELPIALDSCVKVRPYFHGVKSLDGAEFFIEVIFGVLVGVRVFSGEFS
jgi:hypothetical protein